MIRIIQDDNNTFLINCVAKAFELLPAKYRSEIIHANQEIRVCTSLEVEGLNGAPAPFYGMATHTMSRMTQCFPFNNLMQPTIIFGESVEKAFSEERVIEIAIHELVHIAQIVSNRLEVILQNNVVTKYWEGKEYVVFHIADAKKHSHRAELKMPWEQEAHGVIVPKVTVTEWFKLQYQQFKLAYTFASNKHIQVEIPAITLAAKSVARFSTTHA
jgi:hypothetical protein